MICMRLINSGFLQFKFRKMHEPKIKETRYMGTRTNAHNRTKSQRKRIQNYRKVFKIISIQIIYCVLK